MRSSTLLVHDDEATGAQQLDDQVGVCDVSLVDDGDVEAAGRPLPDGPRRARDPPGCGRGPRGRRGLHRHQESADRVAHPSSRHHSTVAHTPAFWWSLRPRGPRRAPAESASSSRPGSASPSLRQRGLRHAEALPQDHAEGCAADHVEREVGPGVDAGEGDEEGQSQAGRRHCRPRWGAATAYKAKATGHDRPRPTHDAQNLPGGSGARRGPQGRASAAAGTAERRVRQVVQHQAGEALALGQVRVAGQDEGIDADAPGRRRAWRAPGRGRRRWRRRPRTGPGRCRSTGPSSTKPSSHRPRRAARPGGRTPAEAVSSDRERIAAPTPSSSRRHEAAGARPAPRASVSRTITWARGSRSAAPGPRSAASARISSTVAATAPRCRATCRNTSASSAATCAWRRVEKPAEVRGAGMPPRPVRCAADRSPGPTNSPRCSTGSPSSSVRSACISSRVRWYRGPLGSASPGQVAAR